MKLEQLITEVIKEIEKQQPNGFNFTEVNKLNTIWLLYALRGFHSEEGTTPEQNDLLVACGLMNRS